MFLAPSVDDVISSAVSYEAMKASPKTTLTGAIFFAGDTTSVSRFLQVVIFLKIGMCIKCSRHDFNTSLNYQLLALDKLRSHCRVTFSQQ